MAEQRWNALPRPAICVVATTSDLEKTSAWEPITLARSNAMHIFDEHDPLFEVKVRYCSQTIHLLGRPEDQKKVPIYIHRSLDQSWKPHIYNSIKVINAAAPGLLLYTCNCSRALVTVRGDDLHGDGAYTYNNILSPHTVEINLSSSWRDDAKAGTCTHELLHALGAKHEFQQDGMNEYLETECADDSVETNSYRGITRFDPFSVMMYSENGYICRKQGSDTVWNLKPGKERFQKMSELDKVGLNLLYPPCIGPNYIPIVSPVTHMLYCGREVMNTNNLPCPSNTIDDKCGPIIGPNCPACRVLIEPVHVKVQEMNEQKKWQGWTGHFYCGRRFSTRKVYYRKHQCVEHDGMCGPNNGLPCNECGRLLYPDYDYGLNMLK